MLAGAGVAAVASVAATVGPGAAAAAGAAPGAGTAPGMVPPLEATQAANYSAVTTSTAIGM